VTDLRPAGFLTVFAQIIGIATFKSSFLNPSFLQQRLKLPEIDFFGLIPAVFLRKSLVSNAGFLV
jgi:hypothetical protein